MRMRGGWGRWEEWTDGRCGVDAEYLWFREFANEWWVRCADGKGSAMKPGEWKTGLHRSRSCQPILFA